MTRRRAAVVLLLALAWCAASPWLGVGRAPASAGPVISTGACDAAAPAWLPRQVAAEQLARLSQHDADPIAPAVDPHRRVVQAATARPGPAPRARRLAHRRARWRRRARATDEPS